jgi:hypothetical protein
MKGLLPIRLRHVFLATALFALIGAPALMCAQRNAMPVPVNTNTPEQSTTMVMCPAYNNSCVCTVSYGSGLAGMDSDFIVPLAESRAWVFSDSISARLAHYSNSARGPPPIYILT